MGDPSHRVLYPRSAEPPTPKDEIPDLKEKLTEAEYFL